MKIIIVIVSVSIITLLIAAFGLYCAYILFTVGDYILALALTVFSIWILVTLLYVSYQIVTLLVELKKLNCQDAHTMD